MTFSSPFLLVLLLVLPLVWYIGRPRYVFRRRRDIASLLVRSLLVLLLVLALAGLQVVQAVDKLAVVFLVDASDSMGGTARDAQLAFIRQAVAAKPTEDEWAVVVFGGSVSIEKPFSAISEVLPIRSTILGNNTHLAEAIQTALSLFPPDAVRRIVILSDGRETIGNALAKAQLAEAAGVEISYVPLARPPVPDVRVTALDAPARVVAGQEFEINVAIEAEAPTAATLLIFSGGTLIREAEVTLRGGITGYTLTQTATESGFLNFSARVEVEGDGISQNNELAAFSEIVGAPRVLLLTNDPTETANLLPALTSVGLAVDVRQPANLPPDTAALADYKSIVIVNVPATEFSLEQMRLLQTYVRDLGGGLVFIGGPESFGPGGYYKTPLEETLPVETQIKDQQRIPQLTIGYLIDRSGSMAVVDRSGIANIELAKRAIDLSIEFLQPTDRAGIATFDAGGAWVAEFQNIEDRTQLQRLLATLRPGGGTDILAGMKLMEGSIINEPSERKHLILLTDGGADARGLVDLTRTLNEQYGVTTSVIAIGTNPPLFLRSMSEVGGGNFHVVTDVGQIPNIFTMETVLATRSYIEEGDFNAVLTLNSPIMSGITALPAYRGYVVTSAKATAQAVLRGPAPFSDPLLVQWQYGLGRAVAFTSDATGRWAADWVTWGDFARFWGQVVSWTMPASDENNLETRITMTANNQARIVIDARDETGAFLNNLTLSANVLDPTEQGRSVVLQQVAPGRYEGTFIPEDEGAYFVAISGTNPDGSALREVNGWVLSYSPEYVPSATNNTLLANIAQVTGGSDLTTEPTQTFVHGANFRTATAPAAPILLLLVAFLLPLDIAIRRLLVSRSDLQRLWAYLFPQQTVSSAQVERLSTLQAARRRAREQGQRDDLPLPERPPQPEPTSPEPAIPQVKIKVAKPVAGEESTVGALLKRRKRDDE